MSKWPPHANFAAMTELSNLAYIHNPLDRAGHHRTDRAWLRARLKDPASRIVPLFDLKPFVLKATPTEPPCLGWLKPGLLDISLDGAGAVIFLGLDEGRAHFAVDLTLAHDPSAPGGLLDGFGGTFKDLRSAVMSGDLTGPEASIAAQAKAMIEWHRRHKFCAQCGKSTEITEGGYKRQCETCKAEHFPRTDPVVIMLATRGDKALLGRGKNFPGKMFSALAGFVEPGETIEQAVAREIMEEAGIQTGAVRYFATQPWPYPMSLMIGCFADATSEDIKIDETELADARWMTRAELKAALEGTGGGDFFLPPPLAIAHHLIKAFVEG